MDKPICDECGKEKTKVKEPLISGITGWFCTNKNCSNDK